MIQHPHQHSYKRLETDAEFRARVQVADKSRRCFLDGSLDDVAGDGLDNHAWHHHKMQRRIVEAQS